MEMRVILLHLFHSMCAIFQISFANLIVELADFKFELGGTTARYNPDTFLGINRGTMGYVYDSEMANHVLVIVSLGHKTWARLRVETIFIRQNPCNSFIMSRSTVFGAAASSDSEKRHTGRCTGKLGVVFESYEYQQCVKQGLQSKL